MHSMTNTNQQALPQLIALYQQRLRLQTWDIQVSMRKPERKNHLMEIAINRRRRHAAIRVSDQALLKPREEFEYLVLHELTHIIMEEIDYEVKGSDIEARHEEASERAVDHIAKVLYSAFSS